MQSITIILLMTIVVTWDMCSPKSFHIKLVLSFFVSIALQTCDPFRRITFRCEMALILRTFVISSILMSNFKSSTLNCRLFWIRNASETWNSNKIAHLQSFFSSLCIGMLCNSIFFYFKIILRNVFLVRSFLFLSCSDFEQKASSFTVCS